MPASCWNIIHYKLYLRASANKNAIGGFAFQITPCLTYLGWTFSAGVATCSSSCGEPFNLPKITAAHLLYTDIVYALFSDFKVYLSFLSPLPIDPDYSVCMTQDESLKSQQVISEYFVIVSSDRFSIWLKSNFFFLEPYKGQPIINRGLWQKIFTGRYPWSCITKAA